MAPRTALRVPRRADPPHRESGRVQRGPQLDELEVAAVAVDILGDEEARARLEQARREAVHHSAAASLDALGCLYLPSGQLEAARAHFEAALRLDPHLAAASLHMALVSCHESKLDRALEQVDRGLELDGGSTALLSLRARIRLSRDERELAEKDLTRVIALDPGDLTALSIRARLRLERGALAAASADARSVLELEPRYCDALYVIGSVLEKSGRLEDALIELQRAVANAPLDTTVDSIYVSSRLERAEIFAKLGRRDEARTEYRELLETLPARSRAAEETRRRSEELDRR